MPRVLASSSDWKLEDTPIPIGRRASSRLRLSIPAKLQTLCDNRRCILIDLSRGGAAIALEKPLRLDEGVILQVASIDQFGTVVRQRKSENGGVNGIRFENELTDSEVVNLRHFADGIEDIEKTRLLREARQWVTGSF